MPAFFSFGFFKNDQITSGGTVGFGQNIIQNRSAAKTNNGSVNVGDGLNNLPIILHANLDPDAQDQNAIDAQNFSGPQV